MIKDLLATTKIAYNKGFTSTTNLNCSQRIHWYNSLVLQRPFGIIRCEFLKFVVLATTRITYNKG